MQKLKDTKVGAWLKDKAPQILDVAGDLLPDSGALGIVKNLIKHDDKIPPADQIEGMKLLQDFELEMEREMTKRIEGNQQLEVVQLQQEDLFTKRARPTRQYFWLLFLIVCYPVSFWIGGSVIALPEIILIGIFGDFGFYTWKRTEEKIKLSK